MGRRNGRTGRTWLRLAWGCCASLAGLALPMESRGICGLDAAAFDQIADVLDPSAAQAWARRISLPDGGSCVVCHLDGFGPRNRYGAAIDVFLSGNDREDALRKREAGRRVGEIPADPSRPDSPTFGELIRRGLLPAADVPADVVGAAAPAEELTVERARELVRQAERESPFGILQLSRTSAVTADVAAALAEFRGEMLVLGLKTLPPDVARALEKSRVATVWLHSVTAVGPEAAAAIAGVAGDLVLSGLVELDSLPLAGKLARRPGPASFPYLRSIGPEIAAALAATQGGLALTAVTEVSPQAQGALAETVGSLTLPNLKALDSVPLTRKLAAGYASAVLLPRIETLSVEQAEEIAAVRRPFFLGGIRLPLGVMTEEVAAVFARNPQAGRLALGAGPISDAAFRTLMEAPLSVELRDLEAFSDAQVRILAAAPGRVPGGPFGSRCKIAVPRLRRLDSGPLAAALLRCAAGFGGVTAISPEAAAALGGVPEAAAGAADDVPLSFPCLEELGPDVARLLMNRRWSSIALPSLRDLSPDAARSLVRQTSLLTLGITALTPELAAVFAEMASNKGDLGGGQLAFPCLAEMSPVAARALAAALNRGSEVPSWGGLDRSPQLFIGGRGLAAVCPPLPAALAAELARYRGRLSIAGLRELAPEAATALASYRGPSLDLSGPATDAVTPETAAALAAFPGTLRLPLRVLDSAALAGKLARQTSRTTDGLESISAAAIPALVSGRDFFTLRQLPVLDSPELAARLIQDSSGQVLPSLREITPAAAETLVAGPNEVWLGLIALDDPAVASALTKARKGVRLPRLRAATPQVMRILEEARSVTTPPLRSLYVLGAGPADVRTPVGTDDFPVGR